MLNTSRRSTRAEGPWSDLALHTIGWKAFQDLCSQVCEESFLRPVEIFREAQDGGQDAVFLLRESVNNQTAVGTVQCKYSSDAKKSLRLSDLTDELDSISSLVAAGQADTYVLMTSMSVDAPAAVTIRQRLRSVGVRKPHILGRQYVVRAIRSSPRLRALVPQVYGLGDLSAILDERTIEQSRALLDEWVPKLKVYVPTAPHRRAVRALDEHGVVLLLGNPSSGKSAIGAILSTMAADDPSHTVLTLTSPRDFERGWNPHDPGRFFWIDDAFGSNIVRDEYVQDWASTFRKVQAAISRGNRFLLTSRYHIYEAAKARLGERNFPLFSDGRAVVDVGELSDDEKRQILYNHISFGAQTQSWKRNVKAHLEAVAQVDNFLPGIAERLGNPMFTKSLPINKESLIQFMEKPKPHLIDTINALEEPLRAALILTYVNQGRFEERSSDTPSARVASETCGVPVQRILASLHELRGSFLKCSVDRGNRNWGFFHPTIADALTDILKERPHMVGALLRGAPIATILSGCVCEGAGHLIDGLKIPASLNDVLVDRLVRAVDEVSVNASLFQFLDSRTTDDVFQSVVLSDPDILLRESWSWSRASRTPRLRAAARAAKLGCLDEGVRDLLAAEIERLFDGALDLSCLEDQSLLGLIPPLRLIALGIRLQTELLPSAPQKILEAAEEVDLNYESESVFEKYSRGLETLRELHDLSEDTTELIGEAERAIDEGLEAARERASESKRESSETWKNMSASAHSEAPPQKTGGQTRSIFTDVDYDR